VHTMRSRSEGKAEGLNHLLREEQHGTPALHTDHAPGAYQHPYPRVPPSEPERPGCTQRQLPWEKDSYGQNAGDHKAGMGTCVVAHVWREHPCVQVRPPREHGRHSRGDALQLRHPTHGPKAQARRHVPSATPPEAQHSSTAHIALQHSAVQLSIAQHTTAQRPSRLGTSGGMREVGEGGRSRWTAVAARSAARSHQSRGSAPGSR